MVPVHRLLSLGGPGHRRRVIDVPGFGDDLEKDEANVEELVQICVIAFVIIFEGQSPRLT